MKTPFLLLLNTTLLFSSTAQTPSLQWAKNFGNGVGYSIAVDLSGNVYTTGLFNNTSDFDPGPGTYTMAPQSIGTNDIFISKLDATGNFVWAKSMGGVNRDQGNAIAIDASGNVYTTGNFQSTADFDPGPGTFTLTSLGNADIFISKLDASGNFVWAKSIGVGGASDIGNAIAVDATGNVCIMGDFTGTTDFDPGPAVFTLASNSRDIFIVKLDATGNFIWANSIHPNNGGSGFSMKVDATNNIYVSGIVSTGVTDFDPGPGTYTLNSGSLFILKLDQTGNFVWAIEIDQGTNNPTATTAINVDAIGNVYMTGRFVGTTDFDPGPGTYTLSADLVSHCDVFVLKLDALGNFIWAKSFGGFSDDIGKSITVDALKNVYTMGVFNGVVDFDSGPGTYTLSPGNIFISKLDSLGNFIWAGNIAGSISANSITQAFNNLYFTGTFAGTVDFDPNPTTSSLTATAQDIFIAKLTQPYVGIKENTFIDNLNVFPNPNNGSFKILVDSEIQNSELILINSIGQKVFEQKIIRGENNIIRKGLSSGLYHYIVLQNKQQMGNGKMIIE